ncbi:MULTISPECIES: ATP-dependent Clp protease adaptor ClpS [unclassified Lentimicrobium]|uniref:ATP-dependent Clp protease adaptor ClpS n=1 Tax=unclassified Lentimicrobium TaxID=2677434 RepID=UPI0015545CCB|nr:MULTISPECIES: ATP-dependent Clp protease adaptor ClpS [unclassified Lentimicrobium]NPD46793.1 ATP-dependent Clp protease adaptor ClpS [Lentimicrobium sp. S6]NPD85596.1 ATP-dependent Clp protease adaptor ClpS [Lentimicrobium sp. L6]
MSQEQHQFDYESSELLEENKSLILFNDDHNTFDFVIETLIDVCEHDPLQAEQCALIVHHKGKCQVKSGSYNELKPSFREMSDRDLTVAID